MILALDVGNSQIYCGVFRDQELVTQFRHASTARSTSDEIGVFLRGALRENDVDPEEIQTIAISSVVPELNYSLRSCCQKYFKIEPMLMRPGIKTGLKIAYKDLEGNRIDPSRIEQGTDFIAEVKLSTTALYSSYRDLSLTQIFPSGWEIINKRMYGMPDALNESLFEYRDIRDDRVMTYFSLALMFCVIGMSLFSLEVIKIASRDIVYWESANIVAIMSFSFFFGMMKDNALMGLHIVKKTKITGSLIVLASLINLGFNILLIPRFSIYGAAFATLI